MYKINRGLREWSLDINLFMPEFSLGFSQQILLHILFV